MVLTCTSDIGVIGDMIFIFGKQIKFIHTRLEHIFNAPVRTMMSRKHPLACRFNATLLKEPGKMNNTLGLLEADLRIAVLKNKFGNVSRCVWTDVLSFLLKEGKAPLSMKLMRAR